MKRKKDYFDFNAYLDHSADHQKQSEKKPRDEGSQLIKAGIHRVRSESANGDYKSIYKVDKSILEKVC